MATGTAPYHCSHSKRRCRKRRTAQTYCHLPYVYRVWMAVRKSKVRQWAIKLNDDRFTSPETLVWEIVARGELANIRWKHFSAAYID
eukprot:9831365-Heterocapsa_arctica.AAC.1